MKTKEKLDIVLLPGISSCMNGASDNGGMDEEASDSELSEEFSDNEKSSLSEEKCNEKTEKTNTEANIQLIHTNLLSQLPEKLTIRELIPTQKCILTRRKSTSNIPSVDAIHSMSFLLSPTFDHNRVLAHKYNGEKKVTQINLYSNIITDNFKSCRPITNYNGSNFNYFANCKRNGSRETKSGANQQKNAMSFLHIKGYH